MKNMSNNVKLSVMIRGRIISENMTGKIITWNVLKLKDGVSTNKNLIKHLKHWFIIEEKENGFVFNNKIRKDK